MDLDSNRTRHVIGLDAVRFWAAGSVMLFHLAFWSWASPSDLPFRAAAGRVRFEELEAFTWFGWTGVETFFVLSGFVICATAQRATPYGFLRGRVARLYPAVWICATGTAIVAFSVGLSTPAQLLAAYLRSMAIDPSGPWVDAVYRTLIVEGVFYGLVLVFLTLRAFRHVETVAIAIGVYSLCFWLAGSLVDFRHLAPGAILNFSKYGIFFSLGMMIWIVADRGLSPRRVLALCILTVCGGCEVHLVAAGMEPFLTRSHGMVPLAVWLASVAAIMVSVWRHDGIDRLCGRHAPFFKTIGLMTYPLYLIHDVAGAVALRSAVFVGRIPALGIALSVSLAASYLTVRLEPRLRRPLLRGLDAIGGRLQGLGAAFWFRASRPGERDAGNCDVRRDLVTPLSDLRPRAAPP